MLNKFARAIFTRLLSPIAAFLLRIGITPDAITIIGTLGVCIGALVLYPTGHLFAGTIVITVFVLSDMLDGIMARMSSRSSVWGAFLDSSLDRFGDSAVFCGIALWYFFGGDHRDTALLALACLILGSIVSYVRAKAEGLGLKAGGGIAERADRLLLALAFTGFVSIGLPRIFLTIVLALLALASLFTIWQRMSRVREQTLLAVHADARVAAKDTDAPDDTDAESDPLAHRWDEWTPEADGMLSRRAARVIVVDDSGRTLLLRGHDTEDADHRWWFTVGGGLLDGEDPARGAARELHEETGLALQPSELTGPVARRSAEFEFATRSVRQHEEFFLAQMSGPVHLASDGWTELEKQTLDEFRWWTVAEIRSSAETVYPLQLADVVSKYLSGNWDGNCRVID